ncbi:hypothetical protein EG349_10330 [Chryseobacterium shandongense]|uniref:Uncharacterized protein n=2 Tax=Chryseobacterium TaxID=59732 RepID=A0AAD1DLU3_9FLAO|nr:MULTISPECIES: hypothetical protein [Chryseobacterium]AZA87156.1 hypothetical protein EG349_10330 [Chryseobacterium shandongense]AZA95585.1 hypothetical protein EG353_08405 [Chryseobacterium shandongense]MEC3876135.1 hypothetical protein [Chryseobacterium sp. T9W2-O]
MDTTVKTENTQMVETNDQEIITIEKAEKELINDLYYESDDFGRFSEDEVKGFRLKYGKRLRYLKVVTPDGESEFIIKKPSRATSSAVREAIDKNDEDLAQTIMLTNCVVEGDIQDIEDDAVVFTKVTTFITSMVKEAELEAKKL